MPTCVPVCKCWIDVTSVFAHCIIKVVFFSTWRKAKAKILVLSHFAFVPMAVGGARAPTSNFLRSVPNGSIFRCLKVYPFRLRVFAGILALNAQSCVVLLYLRPAYAKSGAGKLVSDGQSVQLMSIAASYVSRVRLCEVVLFELKNWVCLVTILCSKYCEFNKPIVRLLGWLARHAKSTLSSPQPMRAHLESHEPRRLPKTT